MDETETTTEELRELVRDGHGLLKDLTRAQRDLRTLITEAQDYIRQAQVVDRNEAVKAVNEVIEKAKAEIVESTIPMIDDINTFVQKIVFERFDVLMDTLLGYSQGSRADSIPDLLRGHGIKLPPDFDKTILAPTRPKGGVPHTHTSYVEGCYRCELNKDEA